MVAIFFCCLVSLFLLRQNLNIMNQPTLRHQIAAAIDPSLAVSVEPVTAADIAAAAAYAAQRKAVKIVDGGIVDGTAVLTQDHLFFNWVNAGGLEIPGAQLPDFILGLVNQFNNQSGLNIK
jgi:hypothetical protein